LGLIRLGINGLFKPFQRSPELASFGRLQRPVDVLQDDAGLIVPALIDVGTGIGVATAELRCVCLVRDHERVTGPERCLVVEVAAVGLAKIVTVEFGGRVGRCLVDHRVIVAVKELDFILLQDC
jgi:hypothetical protein